MKVLVTGATGRLGPNLIKLLVEKGHTITAMVEPGDTRVSKFKGMDVRTIEGSITDREACLKAVEGQEAIYHLGAVMGGGDNYSSFDVNLAAVFYMLEAAARKCPNLHRFIFASSDVCIPHSGEIPEIIPWQETIQPVGMYTLGKRVGEIFCHSYHLAQKVPTVAPRFPNMMGIGEILTRIGWFAVSTYRGRCDMANPTPEDKKAIEAFRKLDKGDDKQLLVPRCPSGRAYKKHTGDVRDVANGLILCLEKDEAVGLAFPMPGLPIRWDVAVPYMAEKLGREYIDVKVPGPGMYYEYDLSKARQVLGYNPVHDEKSMVDIALSVQRGEETGWFPP